MERDGRIRVVGNNGRLIPNPLSLVDGFGTRLGIMGEFSFDS